MFYSYLSKGQWVADSDTLKTVGAACVCACVTISLPRAKRPPTLRTQSMTSSESLGAGEQPSLDVDTWAGKVLMQDFRCRFVAWLLHVQLE
jgi:hypothetical protein